MSRTCLALVIVVQVLPMPQASCQQVDPAAAVRAVLDDFHDAASQADGERYFAHFTADAVFLGTDPAERWTVEEFRAYAMPYFATGRGWTYLPRARFVSFAPDGVVAWFDERLHNDRYGAVRGTGVLLLAGDRWRIAHYSLTFLIPNDDVGRIIDLARDTEPADATPSAETTSLLGVPLHRAAFAEERMATLEEELAAAEARHREAPTNVEALIWHGRRLGYLWRYREAIAVYSRGLETHPEDPRLYRHRGHRYISIRDFAAAAADLRQAAKLITDRPDEVEPDGQPNAAGIPTSTLHTNIYYHLGLALYLQADYEGALAAYEKCLAAATNDDMRVATLDWMIMTLRRLGRAGETERALTSIHADMELLENHAYHRRLLMYKGELDPESLLDLEDGDDAALLLATHGYGVGNYYLATGDSERAVEVFRQVVGGNYWPAFGFIAAEADLARRAEK